MRIRCRYTGIKGFVRIYEDAIRWGYMITEKAKRKARVLVFWEKHGLQATLDAFPVKESTLYGWKKQWREGGGMIEALNDTSRSPRIRRKRLWPEEIIQEVKRLRQDRPNLGKEKIHPLLMEFCEEKCLKCPAIPTIGRIIKDCGGLRSFPQKISHFGKIKKTDRKKILRKPLDFRAKYPGHLVALDTIEKHIDGSRRYVITFEDIFTRLSFAWATTSHASKAASEFFSICLKAFPFPLDFQRVLTDNGSEFKKHFDMELRRLHLVHYHTYPKTPKMNAHLERFNRTVQDEFVDYHIGDLLVVRDFNRKLMDWLIWYNARRVHYAFKNKLSPLQFMMMKQGEQSDSSFSSLTGNSRIGWTYTIH